MKGIKIFLISYLWFPNRFLHTGQTFNSVTKTCWLCKANFISWHLKCSAYNNPFINCTDLLSWINRCKETCRNFVILDTGTLSGRISRASIGFMWAACLSKRCRANSRSGCAVFGDRVSPGKVRGELLGSKMSLIKETYT